jgi:hypothetical protein
MTAVPRSLEEILASADRLADRFEAYDPAPGDRDTLDPTTALWLAASRRADAERDLAAAVVDARRAGVPWKVVGELVGTSGEAARQRYGRHVAR